MARINTREMHRLRDEFKAQCAAANEPCWLCGLLIDYQAAGDDYTNDDRFQLDHFYPVSTHPDLQTDPTNFRASHAGCNRERGNGSAILTIGIPSRQWA